VERDLRDELAQLIVGYLEVGCPCRFPRFRAVVARDTSRVAGGSFTSAEQTGLIEAFEQRVPLVDRGPLEGSGGPAQAGMYQAKCRVCGSRVARSSNELAPGGWVDYLSIRAAPDAADLGAPVEHGRVYRPCPLVAAGPGMTGMQRAAEAFPMIGRDEWLAWMRERAC
jgi:hypothetical protein